MAQAHTPRHHDTTTLHGEHRAGRAALVLCFSRGLCSLHYSSDYWRAGLSGCGQLACRTGRKVWRRLGEGAGDGGAVSGPWSISIDGGERASRRSRVRHLVSEDFSARTQFLRDLRTQERDRHAPPPPPPRWRRAAVGQHACGALGGGRLEGAPARGCPGRPAHGASITAQDRRRCRCRCRCGRRRQRHRRRLWACSMVAPQGGQRWWPRRGRAAVVVVLPRCVTFL